jgi:DNA repair protein RadD
MFDLRYYQDSLATKTIDHMLEGGAPCLVSPTGSGKTVILAEVARRFREWGYDVVLAAHRNEIVKQLAASCQRHCGEYVGFYTRKRMTGDQRIMVTMMPTLSRRRHVLSTFKGRVLLLDEAHHIQARTYREIIREIRPVFFAGATATPITPTGAGLGKFGITKLIIGPQPKQLMDEGSMCKYRMFGGDTVVDTTGVPTQNGDYNSKEIEKRIVEVDGDFLRDLLKFNPDLHPTISVTISVNHAHDLAAEYNRRGISAEVIIGTTPEAQRDRAFERFKAGELKVIVSVSLIDEGLDLPEATCLQLIRPTRSLRLWKQLIGRVLRTDDNRPDKVALIIDHGNCYKRLPLPHIPIDWTLEGKIKIAVGPVSINQDGEVVETEEKEKPAGELVAKGNKREMKELSIEEMYDKEIEKRVKAVKRNLYLVEAKGFTPGILWAYAESPEGLDAEKRRRIERCLGLPLGYCDLRG